MSSNRAPRVFAPGSGPNASLACRRDGVDLFHRQLYREAYEEAVIVLFQHGAQHSKPEKLLLPLGFLWRHLLEVALKNIVGGTREMLIEDLSPAETRAMRTHDLVSLWSHAREHVELLGMTNDLPMSTLNSILVELQTVDPTADGFRYPFKRDALTQTLAKMPAEIDLGRFHAACSLALQSLDRVMSEIDARDDAFLDALMGARAEELGPSVRTRRQFCEQNRAWRAAEQNNDD